MKRMTVLFIVFFSLVGFSHAQLQSTNTNAVSYSQFVQIDSSELYVFGLLLDKTSKPKYNLDRMYNGGIFWTKMFIYNSSTKKSTKVFSQALIQIYPVYVGYNDFGGQNYNSYSTLAKDKFILLARTDKNNDGIIDEEDPLTMYLVDKSGSNLTEVTPKGMNVVSWKLSKSGKTIIAKLQKDSNQDKKFTDEDELIYQIDIDDDITKVKITSIVP